MRILSIVLVVALLFCVGMVVTVSGEEGDNPQALGSSSVFEELAISEFALVSDPSDDTSVLPFTGVEVNGEPLIMGYEVNLQNVIVYIETTTRQWDNTVVFTGLSPDVELVDPYASYSENLVLTDTGVTFTIPQVEYGDAHFKMRVTDDSGEVPMIMEYYIQIQLNVQPFSSMRVNGATIGWEDLTSSYGGTQTAYTSSPTVTIQFNDMLPECFVAAEDYQPPVYASMTAVDATTLLVEFPSGSAPPLQERLYFNIHATDSGGNEKMVSSMLNFNLEYNGEEYVVRVDGSAYPLARVNNTFRNSSAIAIEKASGIEIKIDGWDYAAESELSKETDLEYNGNSLWSLPANAESGQFLIYLYRESSVYELTLQYTKPAETDPTETDPTKDTTETDPTKDTTETDPTKDTTETDPTEPRPTGTTEKGESKYSDGGSDVRDTNPTKPTDPTEETTDGSVEVNLQPTNTVEEDGVSKTALGSDEMTRLLSDLEQARQDDPDGLLVARLQITSSGDVSDYVLDINGEDFMTLQSFAPDALVVDFDGTEIYLWLAGLQGVPVTGDEVVEISLSSQVHNGRPGADVTIQSGKTPVESLEGDYSVQLRIPYQLASGEDPNAIFLEYIHADGTVTPVTESYYDETAGQAVMASCHLSRYGIAYKPSFFSDVPRGHPANPAVTFLAARGLIRQSADGKFSPDAQISRADYTNLLTGALSALNLAPSDVSFYQDVPVTTGYHTATNWVYLNNIAGPIATDSHFRPADGIVREDMATLTDNVLHCMNLRIQPLVTVPAFQDEDEIEGYAKGSISRLYSYGIFPLDTEGRIFPKTVSTKGDAAIVLANLLSSL